MDLTGFPDGPPVKAGNSIADLASGTMAAHGIVLALLARERTGAGQKVEIAMLEVMAALLTYQGQGYLTTGASPRRRVTSTRRSCPTRSSRRPTATSPSGLRTTRSGVASVRRWATPRSPATRASTPRPSASKVATCWCRCSGPSSARPRPRSGSRGRSGGRAGREDQVGRRGAGVGAPPCAWRDRDGDTSDGGAHADGRATDPPPRDARRGRCLPRFWASIGRGPEEDAGYSAEAVAELRAAGVV